MLGIARSAALRTWRGAAGLRDRRFATALCHDPAAPPVVLSPHLDDAVLSCWSALRADPRTRVVNIFTGLPGAGTVAPWDAAMGARDSRARMEERFAEDRAALAAAGVPAPLNLSHPDNQYRRGRPPASLAAIDASLVPRVTTVSRVFAPINLVVAHPDHRQTRAYGQALRAAGIPLTLYADVPYCAEYGWPAWVTDDEPDPYLDVDAIWALSGSGLPADAGARAAARVERLAAADASAKLAAIRIYRTQLSALDRGPVGLISNPRVHGFEVFWDLS